MFIESLNHPLGRLLDITRVPVLLIVFLQRASVSSFELLQLRYVEDVESSENKPWVTVMQVA